jgi:hypothetical protein
LTPYGASFTIPLHYGSAVFPFVYGPPAEFNLVSDDRSNFHAGSSAAPFSALGTGDYVWEHEISPTGPVVIIVSVPEKVRKLHQELGSELCQHAPEAGRVNVTALLSNN